MKTREEIHSELCMLYSRRDVYAHEWARNELTSQSLLDDIWGKIYALRWALGQNIQWGGNHQPQEKGEAGSFEQWPLMCYCYPGCKLPAAQPSPLPDIALEELEAWDRIATPGPWRYAPDWLDWVIGVQDTRPGYTDDVLRIVERPVNNSAGNYRADFALIAAMRNALPGLLARLRAAEALFSLLVEHRKAASDNYDWALEEHGEKSAEAVAAYQGWNELDNLYLKLIEKGGQPRA
jgi:hypothetical protein